MSRMYDSVFCSRSAICEPTSVPMADENSRNSSATPNSSTAVALPRRQPCLARRLTPGSMASDRNSEMTNSTIVPFELRPHEAHGDGDERAGPEDDRGRDHPLRHAGAGDDRTVRRLGQSGVDRLALGVLVGHRVEVNQPTRTVGPAIRRPRVPFATVRIDTPAAARAVLEDERYDRAAGRGRPAGHARLAAGRRTSLQQRRRPRRTAGGRRRAGGRARSRRATGAGELVRRRRGDDAGARPRCRRSASPATSSTSVFAVAAAYQPGADDAAIATADRAVAALPWPRAATTTRAFGSPTASVCSCRPPWPPRR